MRKVLAATLVLIMGLLPILTIVAGSIWLGWEGSVLAVVQLVATTVALEVNRQVQGAKGLGI